MGCARLRGHGHHWPAGRAGRIDIGGRQASVVAHQPGPVLPTARSQYLRPGRDSDALHLSDRQAQPDANPDTVPIGVGQPDGDGDRLGHSVPIAVRHGHAISVAERYREGVGLALG